MALDPHDAADDARAPDVGAVHCVLLMVDLSHFSRTVCDLSAEVIHDLLHQYYRAAHKVVAEAPGARIENYIGDALIISVEAGPDASVEAEATARACGIARALIERPGALPYDALPAKAAIAAGRLFRGPFDATGSVSGLVGAPFIALFRLEAEVREGCILMPETSYAAALKRPEGGRSELGQLPARPRTLTLRGVRSRRFVEVDVASRPMDDGVRERRRVAALRRFERAAGRIARADAKASGFAFLGSALLGLLLYQAPAFHPALGASIHIGLAVTLLAALTILWPRTRREDYGSDDLNRPCLTYYGDVPPRLAAFEERLAEIDRAALEDEDASQALVLEDIAARKEACLRWNIGSAGVTFALILVQAVLSLLAGWAA